MKVKVGDQVEVVSARFLDGDTSYGVREGSSAVVGYQFTVKKVQKSVLGSPDGMWAYDGKSGGGYHTDGLKLVPQFKVGDSVIIDGYADNRSIWNGPATVVQVYSGEVSVFLKKNGWRGLFDNKYIKKIEKKEESVSKAAFKVGDKVRVTKAQMSGDVPKGLEFTITRIVNNNYMPYALGAEGKSRGGVYVANLELAPKVPEVPNGIVAGSKVKLTSKGNPQVVLEGEFESANRTGYKVKLADGVSGNTFAEDEWTLASVATLPTKLGAVIKQEGWVPAVLTGAGWLYLGTWLTHLDAKVDDANVKKRFIPEKLTVLFEGFDD